VRFWTAWFLLWKWSGRRWTTTEQNISNKKISRSSNGKVIFPAQQP
jgi:hypothetical protein